MLTRSLRSYWKNSTCYKQRLDRFDLLQYFTAGAMRRIDSPIARRDGVERLTLSTLSFSSSYRSRFASSSEALCNDQSCSLHNGGALFSRRLKPQTRSPSGIRSRTARKFATPTPQKKVLERVSHGPRCRGTPLGMHHNAPSQ